MEEKHMKLYHKILSAVLVCAMPLSFFTACGGVTQAQLEAYIKEKGYVTREEAEAIAAQNSGTTTIVQQTAESQDLVAAVNAALKANGSDITVTGDKSLNDKAEAYYNVIKKEPSYVNFDDKESVEAYQKYIKERNELENELKAQNLQLLVSESTSTESRAREIANVISNYESDGKRVKSIGYCFAFNSSKRSDYIVSAEYLIAVLSFESTGSTATAE